MNLLILLAKTVSNNSVVSTEQIERIGIGDIIGIFSIFVTIIGFLVTYKCLKKEYNLAIIKEKNLYANSEMKKALNMSYEFLWSYMRAFAYDHESNDEKFVNEAKTFRGIRTKLGKMIINFGSIQSVKLWTYFEHNLLSVQDNNGSVLSNHKNNNYYMMAVLILIITQIKYDVCGLKMSPKYLFLSLFSEEMIEMNDFFNCAIEYNNEIVRELDLDDFLIIDNKKYQ